MKVKCQFLQDYKQNWRETNETGTGAALHPVKEEE